jgi:hypothetical protein
MNHESYLLTSNVKLSLACLVHKNEGILSYRRGRGEDSFGIRDCGLLLIGLILRWNNHYLSISKTVSCIIPVSQYLKRYRVHHILN